jgi:transcriptional regulator with XRE-family HTH domain
MTFGQRLQELRTQAGLSQSQLADRSGIPVWTLRGYEQGRREPLWNVLFKLADALGVDCRAFASCARGDGPIGSKVRPEKSPSGRPRKGR